MPMVISRTIADGSYFESERYKAERLGFEVRESEEYGTIYVDADSREFVKDEYGKLVPIMNNFCYS